MIDPGSQFPAKKSSDMELVTIFQGMYQGVNRKLVVEQSARAGKSGGRFQAMAAQVSLGGRQGAGWAGGRGEAGQIGMAGRAKRERICAIAAQDAGAGKLLVYKFQAAV